MNVTKVGGSAVITATGKDGSLKFYWQPYYENGVFGGGWRAEQAAGPGTIAVNPTGESVAQVGESSVITAPGSDSSLEVYWQAIGAAGWTPDQVFGSQNISYTSVAQVENSAVIAASISDGSLWFYWKTIGAPAIGGWNPEQVSPLPAGFSSAQLAVAQVGQSTVIAAFGSDFNLWVFSQPIGAAGGGGWTYEQASASGYGAAVFTGLSLAQVGNSAGITAIGTDGTGGSLWFFSQPINESGWYAHQVPGLTGASAASVAQVGQSTVIAAIDGNGSLWAFSQPTGDTDFGGPEWNAEQLPGPASVQYSGVSVAQVGQSWVIAATGADGSVWSFSRPIGVEDWSPPQLVALAGSVIA
jgi:hypothetical protein